MRILVVANMYPTDEKPHFGTFVKACVEGYRSQGVEVDLAVLTHTGLRGYLAFYFTAFIKCIFNRYDYVHVHYVTHSIPPVYLANLLRKNKILLNFHGSDAFPEAYESQLRRVVKRKICEVALRKAQAVIVPSGYFKNKIADSYEFKNIIISPSGGVDKTLFKYRAATGKTVMFAGRMIKEKGALLAAAAIKESINLIDKVIIVGQGPVLPEVQSLLDGVEVEYLPLLPREELAKKMTEADVFLFPSIREGESLGLVLVEAIFCGCIPLAIKNGAVSEVLAGPMEVDLSVSEADYIDSLKMLLLKAGNFPLYSQRLYKQVLNKYSTESVSTDLVDMLEASK